MDPTPTFSRRTLLAALAAAPVAALPLGALGAARATPRSPGVSITIDDFDLADSARMGGEARDAAIRAALARHGIRAAGFVAGKYIHGDASDRVLRAWSDGGHVLGNHTYSHDFYDGKDPDATMADILRCEALLASYPGFQKCFRFPYLAEGKTAEARDAMRTRLRQHGYRNGHVTIDTSDWFVDQRLQARLKVTPDAPLEGYRQFYLDHIWDRATYYDGLARAVLGHSIDHTILLHHRLVTGLFLDDLLEQFKTRGWRLVDASTALAQPLFAMEPTALPAGQSLLWALAKSSGKYTDPLRYPGEDGDYEAARMDALGL